LTPEAQRRFYAMLLPPEDPPFWPRRAIFRRAHRYFYHGRAELLRLIVTRIRQKYLVFRSCPNVLREARAIERAAGNRPKVSSPGSDDPFIGKAKACVTL